MKTLKETFEEYYVPYEEPANNKRGFRIAYRYVGPWYVYRIEKETLSRKKRILGVSCIFSTVCFFAASLQDCALNYAAYPVILAMFSLAVFLFEWIGVVWFCVAKEKMTKYSFDEMHMILKIVPLLHAVMSFCTAAACIIMIFMESLSLSTLLVPALYFISGMFSFIIFRIYNAISFERLSNEGI